MGLQFNTEVSVSDIIDMLSFISIVIGGVFALVQWNSNLKVRRAEYIDKLYSKRADERIRKILYTFDQTENWLNRYEKEDEFEIDVDDALSFYSYICYLRNQRLMKDEEFNFFRYDILRILTNNDVQELFKRLSNAAGGTTPSCYKDLIKYGKDELILRY